MAKLFFRYGAMNSGKTTALMQVAHNYRERGLTSLVLKPVVDSKGEEYIVSRLGIRWKVDAVVHEQDDLFAQIANTTAESRPACVLVDEAQFLTKEQVSQLFKVAVMLDVPVICYGLRTDFQLEGFEGSRQLLLLAHSLEELKTICKCGRKAIANTRKVGGEFVFSGEQVAIDGENDVQYETLCGQCYYRLTG